MSNQITDSNLTRYVGEDVRNTAGQLMMMHPEAQKIGMAGMLAVAQLATMSGANPLPFAGEIYVWTDWQNKITVDFGIAFFRRKAREVDTPVWVRNIGSNRIAPSEEPRMMTGQERTENGVPDDAIAAICKAYRMSEYLELLKLNVPWQDAASMIARTGIGIVTYSEMFYTSDRTYNGKVTRRKGDPIPPPTGRTWAWVAKKRAEKDVYRALSLINENYLSLLQSTIAESPVIRQALSAVQIAEDEGIIIIDNELGEEQSVDDFIDETNDLLGFAPKPRWVEKAEKAEELPEGFTLNCAVVVAGEHDEVSGLFIGTTADSHGHTLYRVEINGTEYKVSPNRVTPVPA